MQTVYWENGILKLIDQTKLPHKLQYIHCKSLDEAVECIKSMKVRGAPAIGVTAGFGMALTAFHSKASSTQQLLLELKNAHKKLGEARPTARNLFWAIDRIMECAKTNSQSVRKMKESVVEEALQIKTEDEKINKAIGEHGAKLIKDGYKILTHCNAGWLATSGNYGTALGVIKVAAEQGKNVFVWVDETRPRCQGSRLTAWELLQDGIDHAIIADNAAGYYMQKKEIDICIVGADRITADASVANKIGTYEKAVLAKENGIPFYVAAPLSTFDISLEFGKDVNIEERDEEEVTNMWGFSEGKLKKIRIAPVESRALNPSFDITPSKLISAFITESGIVKPSNIKKLFKK